MSRSPPLIIDTKDYLRIALCRIGDRTAARGPKEGAFFIRVRDEANKYRWQKHDAENASKQAERVPVVRKAQERGLVTDNFTDAANKNRLPVKLAIESYLHECSLSVLCAAWRDINLKNLRFTVTG